MTYTLTSIASSSDYWPTPERWRKVEVLVPVINQHVCRRAHELADPLTKRRDCLDVTDEWALRAYAALYAEQQNTSFRLSRYACRVDVGAGSHSRKVSNFDLIRERLSPKMRNVADVLAHALNSDIRVPCPFEAHFSNRDEDEIITMLNELAGQLRALGQYLPADDPETD